ncbi:MAG TPA: ABC transporter ATP-binding protein [Candidatus Thioglobus sp.]|jgi:ABC-2 type transport system ATP-binding protein|nr:ABC transporter ATP-binding protein [Candidatus Thioglobus sp.]HIL42420.1 ABC transporter ATP-binding protein [Gammaproteobacteria bacterium]
MSSIVSIKGLSKTYDNGFEALKNINLDINKGEILALLGPNGAGKTTLISTICGIITPTLGSVTVDGNDIIKDFRKTREMIGLVPQELTLGAFDKVWSTVNFSRGLFNRKKDDRYLEKLLKDLSLFDKKDAELRTLSGGMKRRVLIAKALSHEPKILFLDEPTAGVDVELRKDMWKIVRKMKDTGVTIILTTHYIEEAQAIADCVGVINNGELLLIEKTKTLMDRLGNKQLIIELRDSISILPQELDEYKLNLSKSGKLITYTYDSESGGESVVKLLKSIGDYGLVTRDMKIEESSLEDIFVNLVKKND